MSIIDFNLKIPNYAKEELDRLIIKYSNKTLKGEYEFDENSMITLMIMTFDKSDSKLLNIDKIIKELKDELKEYYNK
jgi:hypothetical protein